MNRERLTIYLVLIIWMTLQLSVGLSFPLTISGVVHHDNNRNGVMDRSEKGMAGVVVSDGVEVVTTDKEGHYSIATESSRVLFVSLPGDHFANGDFYRRLSGRTSGEMINFPLIKHKTKKTVKFVFFTDPHVTPEPKYNAIAGMQSAIKHMNRQKPAFFLSGGDLVDEADRVCEPEARKRFDLYRRLSGGFNAPLFNSIGNNDNYGIYLEGVGGDTCIVGEKDPSYGPGMYREYFGPDYYSFNYSEYHFIIFNTIEITWTVASSGDTVRTYYGNISQEQIDWAKKDLQHVSRETPIILVGHIPLMAVAPIFSGYWEGQIISYDLESPELKSFKHVVRNTPELINELLAGYNLILALAGHHHNYEADHWADGQHDAYFIVGGSICGRWWSGDREIGGSSWPEGYLLVTLKKGKLEDFEYISYGWKGYDE